VDDTLQVLGRRVQAARARVRKDREDPFLFDSPSREAISNVAELYRLRDLVDELIDGEVIRGRELGAPWDLLGSSRQQAQQRAARALRRQQALTNHAHELRDRSTAIDNASEPGTVNAPFPLQPEGRHDRTA
jgi:signal transduction histidine kinase